MDYEGYRRASQSLAVGNVPTLLMRQGNFTETAPIYDPLTTTASGSGFVRTQFAGNIIPANRFDPKTAILINAYPIPLSSARFNNYTSNVVQNQRWNQGDVRVDHQITPKDNLFARWSIQNTETQVPGTLPPVSLPGVPVPLALGDEGSFAGTSFQPAQHAVASYVKVLSPKLVNEFRAGYSRFRVDYVADAFQPGGALRNKFGIANSNVTPQEQNFPIFSPSSYFGIGQTRSLPIFRRENTFQYVDNMSMTTGQHTLKWGGDFRRRQLTIYQTNQGNGRFNFSPAFTDSRQGSGGDTMASFLLGYPTTTVHDYTFNWPGERGSEVGLYLADDWRVSRNLTLNLGLRWDYYSPFSEVANRWANFNVNTGKIDIAGMNGVDKYAGVKPFYKNWGPRVGFAYQLLTHTVVRGGFGIFYNPAGNEGSSLRLFRQLPFGVTTTISPGDINVGLRVSDGFPALVPPDFSYANNPYGSMFAVAPNFRPGYAEQFNLTVEHEIAPWALVIKGPLIGNLGQHLYNSWDANQPVPSPAPTNTRRPFYAIDPNLAGVSYFASDGLSAYYAGQLTLDKRLGQRPRPTLMATLPAIASSDLAARILTPLCSRTS